MQEVSSLTVICNGIGHGSSVTEIVNPELGLKGKDDVFKDTSVISSNFTFPSISRKDKGILCDDTED